MELLHARVKHTKVFLYLKLKRLFQLLQFDLILILIHKV
jgi:hypothetical protein